MGSHGPTASSSGQGTFQSGWTDAQNDLSLRWMHRSFRWFCHEAAQIFMAILTDKQRRKVQTQRRIV